MVADQYINIRPAGKSGEKAVIMAPYAGMLPAEKLRLVRKLLEERTKQSFLGRLFLNVHKIDDTTVMGTPEGTIVTIVDTYYIFRKGGVSSAEALAAIENYRSTLIRGKMPNGADLSDYVKYRVRLEHSRAVK